MAAAGQMLLVHAKETQASKLRGIPMGANVCGPISNICDESKGMPDGSAQRERRNFVAKPNTYANLAMKSDLISY